MDRFRDVIAIANAHQVPVRGYLSCVIACPYAGPTLPREVGRITEKLLVLGCHEVALGDTIGVGTVGCTRSMLDAALAAAGSDQLAVHFHDT